jgi:hypothetical protein
VFLQGSPLCSVYINYFSKGFFSCHSLFLREPSHHNCDFHIAASCSEIHSNNDLYRTLQDASGTHTWIGLSMSHSKVSRSLRTQKKNLPKSRGSAMSSNSSLTACRTEKAAGLSYKCSIIGVSGPSIKPLAMRGPRAYGMCPATAARRKRNNRT